MLNTGMFYPYDDLPISARHHAEMAEAFKTDGAGISVPQAIRALSARDLLLETYGDAFPFKDLLEPVVLAQKIKNKEIFTFFFVFEGVPVATASIMPDGHGGAELGRTVVRKDFFGHGIGDQLLLARFSFASLYRKQLGIEWIYCTTRSINQRIQVIWLHSPHRLALTNIGFYYVFNTRETYTGFCRHFEPVHSVQNVSCFPEARNLVVAICDQFKNCRASLGEFSEPPRLPSDPPVSHYSKFYTASLRDVEKVFHDANEYQEVFVQSNTEESMLVQQRLLENGFLLTGFHPSFGSHPPFLVFGKLRAGLPIRGANFPKEFDFHPVGIQFKKIYAQFTEGRSVKLVDPFVA